MQASIPFPSDVRSRVEAAMPSLRKDLEDLVRIESVSADPARAGEVHRSAEAVARLMRREGFHRVDIVSAAGGAPSVLAHKRGPDNAPTVLLYAHHDVQPENDSVDWDSPPFEPTERNGRLFGRGAVDDKAGIVAHLGALRVHGDHLPVNVTVFIEGEEEIGSHTLSDLLKEHRERLRADVIVIADSGSWEIGVPALTTSLRGCVRADIEIRTLTHAVHSGMWGGVVPDALITLARLIATLHDDRGNVAVAGLHVGRASELPYPEERLRAESGATLGVDFIGDGTVVERLWSRPALSITGLDAPAVDGASNTLVPIARAKISLRIAPGDTSKNAVARLREHLEARVPWGASLEFTVVEAGEPIQLDAAGKVYEIARAAFKEAWRGIPPVDIGVGGSIPFISELLEAFPEASFLVTAVGDPDARAHGPNEGLHLAEFEKAVVAEALFLAALGVD